MSVARFTVSVPFLPELPENVVTNTFFLKDTFPNEGPFSSTDWDALANDAAAAWESSWLGTGTLRKITVKVYNALGAPPHDPIVTKVRNPNAATTVSNWPTQLSLVLSFKGGQRPWQRGRMYLAPWQAAAFSGAAAQSPRPTQAMQDSALNLAAAIGNLGGVDIDWGIWSRLRSEFTSVQDAWVDDSWDIQRRRKLDATGRTTRHIGE